MKSCGQANYTEVGDPSLGLIEFELNSAAVAVAGKRSGVEEPFNRGQRERSLDAELLKTPS